MMPSQREHGIFLILLVSTSNSIAATYLQFLMQSDSGSLMHQALTTLLSGPLSGQDLLLVTDDHTQRLLDLDQVVEAAGASFTPVFLSTQHSLLHTPRPSHHTKGTLLTALLLFHQDPTDFLLLLADNTNWNPSYLVLFCLNPNLNTTTVLSQPVVQRSQFILLLQTVGQVAHQRILAFTSIPNNIKKPLGAWSSNVTHNRQSLFPPRFINFNRKLLEISTVCYSNPFIYLNKNNECVGVNVDALGIMASKLNFSLGMSFPDTIVYSQKINGTWSSMFGELMYEGKHFVVNLMQVLPALIEDFDSTYPYWLDYFTFVVRNPAPLPQWMNIFYPFSLVTWGLIIASMVIVSSMLALLLYCTNNTSDPFKIAFKIAVGLVNQSVNLSEVKAWWARVWLGVWWLTAQSIIVTVYTGILVSLLMVPAYPPKLHTVEDLAASHLTPIMLEYGTYVSEDLKKQDIPHLKEIGRRLVMDTNMVLSDPYGYIMKKVLGGTHFAIITIDYLLYTLNLKNLLSSTYIVADSIYKNYITWYLPKNTAFTPIISDLLTRLLETGIIGQRYEQHVGGYARRVKRARGDGILNMGHLQGAFILLVLGLGAALLILLLEYLIKTCSLNSASN